jgi:hypothetical protein
MSGRDKAFIADTLTMFSKAGIRKTAAEIRLDVEIGEEVTWPVIDKIRGTHLDNLPYLTKLKDLPWSKQLALVETDLTEMSETNKSQRSEDRSRKSDLARNFDRLQREEKAAAAASKKDAADRQTEIEKKETGDYLRGVEHGGAPHWRS